MHLIWENTIKNLVLLWTGCFKGLDEGSGSYEIESTVWDAIGAASAASSSTIPGCYGARPPNFVADKSSTTADTWSFWSLYIGPVLLERRFKNRKYYDHFVALVHLLQLCMQFTITEDEIETIRLGFIDWVTKFEELYYQHDPARVSACPLTIHALLHLAAMIKSCGPVWAYWAFAMERYCGLIRPAIKSRKRPDASLDRFVVECAQLYQVSLLYGLEDEILPLHSRRPDVVPKYALWTEKYPVCTFLPPISSTRPPFPLVQKIEKHLATRFNMSDRFTAIKKLVDQAEIRQFSKIHLDDRDGDTIWAASMYPSGSSHDRRDASYVRVQALEDKNAHRPRVEPEFEMVTSYGRLQHIFVLNLPASNVVGLAQPEIVILAGITSCKVIRKHPKLDIHYYKDESMTEELYDASCVQCVVGRVFDNGLWAIIDRSGSLSRAVWVPD
ncbi:hypothetical protein OF83DRAFT_1072534 [Amylostereum chailletii]|nr:hypothetical protein OF83DRAFT_1072534 [Amylostereum chailletii]